jgi:hypothetical protein
MKVANKTFLVFNILLLLNWTLLGATHISCQCDSSHHNTEVTSAHQDSDCCSESTTAEAQSKSQSPCIEIDDQESDTCCLNHENLDKENTASIINQIEVCNHSCLTFTSNNAFSYNKITKISFDELTLDYVSTANEIKDALHKILWQEDISLNCESPPIFLLGSSFLC